MPTYTLQGRKVRCTSQRRYHIIVVHDNGAYVDSRTDNIATARDRRDVIHRTSTGLVYVMDSLTSKKVLF